MLSLISMAIKKIRKDSFRKIQSASEQKNKAEFFSQKICQVFSAFDKKKNTWYAWKKINNAASQQSTKILIAA